MPASKRRTMTAGQAVRAYVADHPGEIIRSQDVLDRYREELNKTIRNPFKAVYQAMADLRHTGGIQRIGPAQYKTPGEPKPGIDPDQPGEPTPEEPHAESANDPQPEPIDEPQPAPEPAVTGELLPPGWDRPTPPAPAIDTPHPGAADRDPLTLANRLVSLLEWHGLKPEYHRTASRVSIEWERP